jgi:DNA-directed RNA polymerase subunit omega
MEKKDSKFDIISLPIEFDKKKFGSRYRLAIMAVQRATELSLGALPQIERKSKKVTTTALLEILSGKIDYITGVEAQKAKERIDKIDIKKLLEDRRKTLPDITELEKDLKIYLHEKESTEKVLEELFSESSEESSSSSSEE